MRLKQIKLAGFKSFVDSTTVRFPGNRCAVVGPNGCGKSNIIDAVRWVMGESSARQLRGEEQGDLIFDGAANRKAAGIAIVELVFDNSDGRIGGEFASYAEIAIRREVTREAGSQYYLNGTRCRRRDIQDIFHGTGFGPRSYSIIGQGMISDLVKARPEELRVYLEEAAGISKYKERRRETENRIKHTQENLDRVQDIREELAGQLARLQRQAKAAERYRTLKAEERQLSAELRAIQSRSLSNRLDTMDGDINRRDAALEGKRAEQRRIEAEVEQLRADQTKAADALAQTQGRFYKLGSDIERDEESIRFHRERLEQLRAELAQVVQRGEEAAHQLGLDQSEIETLDKAIAELGPVVEAAEAADSQALTALRGLEEGYKQWEADWDAFNQRAARHERDAGIQAARIDQFSQGIERIEARMAQVEDEGQAPADGGEVDGLAQRIEALERQRNQLEDATGRCLAEHVAAQEALAEHQERLERARTDVQSLRHDLARLQAVQEAALGRSDAGVQAWLHERGLDGSERLGETLSVVSGWEHAVEVVLGDFVQALRVNDLDRYTTGLDAPDVGRLALVEGRLEAEKESELPSLVSLVRRSDFKLDSLLYGVFAAESEAVALQHRAHLKPGESIVTRNGLWVGRDWLRHMPSVDQDAGILERAQDMEALELQLTEADQALEAGKEVVAGAQERIQALEAEREHLRRQTDEVKGQLGELKADHGVRRVRLEEALARRSRSQRERQDAADQLEKERERLEQAQAALRSVEQARDGEDELRRTLTADKSRLAADLERARRAARTAHDRLHACQTEHQGLLSRLQASQTARQRLEAQAEELAERRRRIEHDQVASEDPLPQLERNLQANLQSRVAVEAQLGELRQQSGVVDARLRELQAERNRAEQAVNDVREGLEAARVEREGLRVQAANLAEQVAAAGFELEAVLAQLPEEAVESTWTERLEGLDRRIRRLGPINLAAIDEYDAQSERKAHLDAQHEDLSKALATLFQAIHKIDRVTRERFKDTFERVNAHFGELFPKVFGGGRAYLELTGNDLLDTGVSVMARPLGKRNASVNLLSGGEKALTAIALIFSIFQLNPSPVCLLDEVDAPLDDSNVGRFAELISDMSRDVQFVVVTHNKLTMEMADYLMGVTMGEPGVSRIVSVDVVEAAAMAAA